MTTISSRQQGMSRFAADIPDEQPSAAVLWPEHFDLGITAGAVNYGTSPGDGYCPVPYLYASPHDGPRAMMTLVSAVTSSASVTHEVMPGLPNDGSVATATRRRSR